MKRLFTTLASAALVALAANATQLYVVGGNVDGYQWANGDPSGAMTDLGDGVFEWTGDVLGTNFKITDGTWDDNLIPGTDIVANIGSDGTTMVIGEPYAYFASPSSGNIKFADWMEVLEPTLTLDLNAGTITVTGTPSTEIPEVEWYLRGDENGWSVDELYHFQKQAENLYTLTEVPFTSGYQAFKVATTDWLDQFGGYYGIDLEVGVPYNLVSGDNPSNINANLNGLYNVTLTTGDNPTLLFDKVGGDDPDPDPDPIVDPIAEYAGDIYLIGEMNDWTLADPALKMERTAPGIYEWHGDELLPSFKFNDGTWNNAVIPGSNFVLNIGCDGVAFMDYPVWLTADPDSQNIVFDDIIKVKNVTVTLNLYECTMTITGNAEYAYFTNYFSTTNGTYSPWEEEDGEIIFRQVPFREGYNGFYFYNWRDDNLCYGWTREEYEAWQISGENPITPEKLEVTLNPTSRYETYYVPAELEGYYEVRARFNEDGTLTLKFVEMGPLRTVVNVSVAGGSTVSFGNPNFYVANFDVATDDEYWQFVSYTENGVEKAIETPASLFGLQFTAGNQNDYVFTAEYKGTLEIVDETTGTVELSNTVMISVIDGKIEVKGLAAGTDVVVYNLGGQIIAKRTATQPAMTISLDKGTYVVRAGEAAAKVIL